MPISQIGFKAVEVLNDIFNQKPVQQLVILPAKPVLRESCGCLSNFQPEVKKSKRDMALEKKEPNETDPVVQKTAPERVFTFFYESLHPRDTGFLEEEILQFTKIFITSVQVKQTVDLMNYFTKLINQHNLSEKEFDHLIRFFLTQKNRILDFFEAPEEKKDADDRIQMLCQYIYNQMKKNLNYNKTKLEREIIHFRFFGGELVVCSNTAQIIDMLIGVFPILDIRTFYLSLCLEEEKEPDIIKSNLELILAYVNRGKMEIDDHQIFNPYETLVPDRYLDNNKRWSLIIEPIFFGSTKLGLAVFDMKIEGYIYYVMRRRVLNDALNNAVYVQRVLNQSRNLEKANDELSETLNILKETQEKLIQSEKMSAIGNLVAGISHEINTPIGISVTAASHLDQITRDIAEIYTTNNLKKSDLEKYLKAAEEISAMILTNLQRAHELIGSFKQVAVDQSTEERRKFRVKEYVDQTLLSLKPALKKTDLTIEVKCSDGLELLSFPGVFYQIITNFVMNSAIHGYDKGQKGHVVIEVSVKNKQAMLRYVDDGKGISPELMGKIFDPFVTTRRGQGGTGLGLNIVYNLVTQKLNGSIKCESKAGKGAAFTVTFPIAE
ncbi:MAG TPA: HAMP domain-containing sensor histidine kinase [Bacillota bacterium]|nr:HAMP domain-containing sensor histidine kinase [Bacillota bacterium]